MRRYSLGRRLTRRIELARWLPDVNHPMSCPKERLAGGAIRQSTTKVTPVTEYAGILRSPLVSVLDP